MKKTPTQIYCKRCDKEINRTKDEYGHTLISQWEYKGYCSAECSYLDSNFTQNDWKKEFQGWAFDHDRRYFKSAEGKRLMSLISRLLADARKEVIDEAIDLIKRLKLTKLPYDEIYELATLREETT